MKLALLNTTIATTDGTYTVETVTLDRAIELAQSSDLDSAIGHESAAQIMSELLGVAVPMNRQQFAQQAGQQALVFKLNGRAPEGVILDRGQIEEIGYGFKLMTRTV